MIVASHYGWDTVSGEPPGFYDYLLMAQLISEERVGRHIRSKRGTTSAQEADRLDRLRNLRNL